METQKLKILLLEDNESDAVLIQRVLERSGMDFEAIVANDEQSFLSAIQNNVFDIILSDNYLPQFDATAAIQLIRENKVDTPLILVTGTVSEGFAVSMIKTGACDYILKDRLQRLPHAITTAIERHILKAKQKKDLDDLMQNEANLRHIFENTETGYLLLDTSFNIVLFNKPFSTFSETYMAQPLETGKRAIDLFNQEHQPMVFTMLQDALNGKDNQHQVPFSPHEGTSQWFHISCRAVKDNNLKVTGIVISETDITAKVLG